MEREWLLGEDLALEDNLLDQISFQDLVLQVHCNCRKITSVAVKNELRELLESRLYDMWDLLERNIDRIMAEAMKGRGEYEKGN